MIRMENLSVSYGATRAIRNVTLEIPGNQITAIVGPSGCGKSSLLAALNRMTDLIPGARVDGRVLLDDQDIYGSALHPVDLRRRVGSLFQKPTPFPMSIRGNLQLAVREQGMRDRRQLEALTRRVLEEVGLWEEVRDRLNQPATQLSGGQQQRLCLARALALQPQVLLMDEPCSALDPLAAERVEQLVRRLRERYTVVIVTHNLAQARRIADHVAVFWMQEGAGELIDRGPVDRVFSRPANETTAQYLQGARG